MTKQEEQQQWLSEKISKEVIDEFNKGFVSLIAFGEEFYDTTNGNIRNITKEEFMERISVGCEFAYIFTDSWL